MSKAKVVFTDKMIRALKPGATEIRKSEGNGFTIMVKPSGVKSWAYLYAFQGKRRCLTLGQYPDVSLEAARFKFEDARRLVKNGTDPADLVAEEKAAAKKADTVADLFDDYLERHAKKNKRESSWKEDERLYRVNIAPHWGKRKIGTITRRDCIALLDKYADRPALCNNVLKLARKMFNFAMEKDLLDLSPFAAVKAPVKVETRDRVLSESEIAKLWNTELPKAAMSDEVKRIIRLLLITGQRVGEVCGITTGEVEGNWWNLPAARSKNKRAHRVYLTKTALELLGRPVNGFFFPSPVTRQDPDGKTLYTHIDENAVAYAIRKNLKDYQPRRAIKGAKVSMVQVPEARKMELAHFTPHDLRRTANTLLAACKVPKEYRERVLNHALEKLDGTYNLHDYDEEKQQALEALERRLLEIVGSGAI